MFKYLFKPRRRYLVTYRTRPLNRSVIRKKVIKAYDQSEAFEIAKASRPNLMEVHVVKLLKRRLRNFHFNMPTAVGIFLLGVATTAPWWVATTDAQPVNRAPICPPATTPSPQVSRPQIAVPTGMPDVYVEPQEDEPGDVAGTSRCQFDGNGYCGLLGQETAY